MNTRINEEENVKAAQDAFMDLLELAEAVAKGDQSVDNESLRSEAQETVLALVAGIILADGQYDEGEREFIRLLVDLSDKPGGELAYVSDYAEKWKTASMQVPEFYCAAVRRDAREGTDIARTMRCRIQLIGNYTSISDDKFVASEREMVKQYIALLEDFAEAWSKQAQASGEQPSVREEVDKSAAGAAEPGAAGSNADGTGGAAADATGEVPQAQASPCSGKADAKGPAGWASID